MFLRLRGRTTVVQNSNLMVSPLFLRLVRIRIQMSLREMLTMRLMLTPLREMMTLKLMLTTLRLSLTIESRPGFRIKLRTDSTYTRGFRMCVVSFRMYRMMVVLGRMVTLVTVVITTRGGLDRRLMGTLTMTMMRTLVITSMRRTVITNTSFRRPLETTSEYSSESISVLHSSLRYLKVFYTLLVSSIL